MWSMWRPCSDCFLSVCLQLCYVNLSIKRIWMNELMTIYYFRLLCGRPIVGDYCRLSRVPIGLPENVFDCWWEMFYRSDTFRSSNQQCQSTEGVRVSNDCILEIPNHYRLLYSLRCNLHWTVYDERLSMNGPLSTGGRNAETYVLRHENQPYISAMKSAVAVWRISRYDVIYVSEFSDVTTELR